MARPNVEVGRAKILNISEQLFTEHGYNAVSIRDISEACNLTKAALYYHFPSKGALYGEVIHQYADRLQQQMWEAGKFDGCSVDRLVAILTEYVRLTADRRTNVFQNEKIKSGLNRRENLLLRHKFLSVILDPLEEIIREAVEFGEIQPLPESLSPAAILVGMIHGMLVHESSTHSGHVPIAKIKMVIEIFWRGLSGDHQETRLENAEPYLGVNP